MRLESLRIRNWMPFKGEHHLPGLPPGPIGVVARRVDNPRRSNWSGKTAFLEAIEWCLYGTHRKKQEDRLIHRGEKECEVELTLTGDIVVCRKRPKGGPTSLRVVLDLPWQQDVLTGDAAATKLRELLRMSGEDLRATVNFTQGDTQALVGMLQGERRKLISRWLELELWQRLAEAARDRAKVEQAAYDALLAMPMEPEGRPEEEIQAELAKAQAELQVMAGRVASVEEALIRAQRVEVLSGIREELPKAEERAKQARAALLACGNSSSLQQTLQQALDAEEASAMALGAAEAELRAAQELVQGGFSGTCPIMRGPCPAAAQVERSTATAQQRMEESQAAYDEAVSRLALDRQEAATLQDATVTRHLAAQQFKSALEFVRMLKARLEAEGGKGPVGDPEKLRVVQQRFLESQASTRMRVATLEQELAQAEAVRERRQERQHQLAQAERAVRAAHQVVKAFGPTGIPGKIAKASLGVLEEKANALLVRAGLSFTFGWERETKEPALTCEECGHVYKGKKDKQCPMCNAPRGMKRSDELEILVEDGSGEVEDVRAKSGGTKDLVGSAIRLSGGMMLRELRGSPVAWAMVDEPFGALDAENRDELAKVFTSMLGGVGLLQAFIVSHDTTLLEALPARILITREGSTSRLTLEA